MQSDNRFRNLSPLDHRYYFANRPLFDRLADLLSEEASIRQCVMVESVLLKHLVLHLHRSSSGDGLSEDGPAGDSSVTNIPAGDTSHEWDRDEVMRAIVALPEAVAVEEVYREEETTRHNIRAVVNVIQLHLPQSVRHLVHLGATSVDILDTAAAMRYRDTARQIVVPLLLDLEEALIALAEREADTVSIGRTHGQYAVPITVGFALAEYVSRLGTAIGRIDAAAGELRGKLAGAVGAYNATSVLHRDPAKLEREVLRELGLEPGEHATQIVSPEPLLRLLLEMNIAFGVIANLADDLRHLQRSEIGEFAEYFGEGQVGSSTMPHKRNPWNAEHVKSLWKTFSPRATTWFMDQISEHQRDLSNSASGRFVVEYIAGFVAAAERMRSIVSRLSVDREGIERNLREGARRVVAEPLYILLAAGGTADAHEQVRRLTLESDRTGESIIDLARRDTALWDTVTATYRRLSGGDPELFFSDPARYTGLAAKRTREICKNHRAQLLGMR